MDLQIVEVMIGHGDGESAAECQAAFFCAAVRVGQQPPRAGANGIDVEPSVSV